jgi:hypothetical protein
MNKYEAIIIIILGLAGSLLWYKLWVEPNDEHMRKIMNCMNDEQAVSPDHSRVVYDRCVGKLRDKK